MNRYSAGLIGIPAILIVLFLVAELLPSNLQQYFLREDGVIENVTLAGYFICLLLIQQGGGWSWIKDRWQLVVLLTLMLLREADMHVRFTDHSLLGTRLYVQPETSILTIIVGVAIFVLLLYVVYHAISTYLGWLIEQIKTRQSGAEYILLALLLAGASISFDGIRRKLQTIHVDISDATEYRFMQLEEIAEMGIPFALCFAAICYFGSARRSEAGFG